MQLQTDPLTPFLTSDSPLALHVRARCGKPRAGDRARRTQLGSEIIARQGPDGRWDACAGRTINALFALWLLGQTPGEATARGVNALLEADFPLPARSRHDEGFDMLSCHVGRSELARMENVPFTMGCSLFVKTGAGLFFAARFGQGDQARIAAARKVFDTRAKAPKRRGCWCSGPCANNIVQAYAASSDLAAGPAMRLVTAYLASQQRPSGEWGGEIPFYPTLFALAQVPGKKAEAQLMRAAQRLARTQNHDGTWGRSRRELCTFLALDALQRVGMLDVLPASANS